MRERAKVAREGGLSMREPYARKRAKHDLRESETRGRAKPERELSMRERAKHEKQPSTGEV